MKLRFTRQFDQMDCGPACIRMVAYHYGKDYPLSYLRTLSHLTREGVSVAGIRDALNQIGADSASFEMTLEQLCEKCPLPAILHWEQNHFVVLYNIKQSKWTGKRKYYVANPAYGKHAFSEDSFKRFWLNGKNGVVIAIEPRDEFFDKKSVKEKHSLLRFARTYVWPFRWELSQSAFGMFFGMFLSLVTPFLTQAMVDDGIGMRDMGLILNILFAQIFIFIGTFLIGLISSYVSLYMSTRININVLSDYLTKLLKLPMTFFDTKSVGDYQQRLGDHGRLQGFVTYSTLQTFFSIISAPFYLTIIGWYSSVILCVYLLLTGLSMAWMAYFFRRRKAMDYEQFKINTENQNKQYELMSGIVDQTVRLRKAGIEVILVSSGAVASGKSIVRCDRKLDSVSARQLYSSVGQARLINMYYELFDRHGIVCGQVLTTKESLSTRDHSNSGLSTTMS